MKTQKEMLRLTPKEEEIMELFWERGPMFIRELQELYADPKPHFNTLSTMVRILEDKGFTSHEAYGKSYRYFAAVDRNTFRTSSLKNIIDKYFGSSAFSAISTLVRNESLSENEIRELIRMARKTDGN